MATAPQNEQGEDALSKLDKELQKEQDELQNTFDDLINEDDRQDNDENQSQHNSQDSKLNENDNIDNHSKHDSENNDHSQHNSENDSNNEQDSNQDNENDNQNQESNGEDPLAAAAFLYKDQNTSEDDPPSSQDEDIDIDIAGTTDNNKDEGENKESNLAQHSNANQNQTQHDSNAVKPNLAQHSNANQTQHSNANNDADPPTDPRIQNQTNINQMQTTQKQTNPNQTQPNSDQIIHQANINSTLSILNTQPLQRRPGNSMRPKKKRKLNLGEKIRSMEDGIYAMQTDVQFDLNSMNSKLQKLENTNNNYQSVLTNLTKMLSDITTLQANSSNNNNNNNNNNSNTDNIFGSVNRSKVKTSVAQNQINLALKLNMKFNGKGQNKKQKALDFKNVIKNWRTRGEKILGWNDTSAVFTLINTLEDDALLLYNSNPNINDIDTIDDFITWLDKSYDVMSLREVIYKELLPKGFKIPPNTPIDEIVDIYKLKLASYQAAGEHASNELLLHTTLTEDTKLRAIYSVLPNKVKSELKNVNKSDSRTLTTIEILHDFLIKVKSNLQSDRIIDGFDDNKDDPTDMGHINYINNSTYRGRGRGNGFRRGYYNTNYRGTRGRGYGRSRNNNYNNNYNRNNRGFGQYIQPRGRGYRGRGGGNRGRGSATYNHRQGTPFYIPEYFNGQCTICKLNGHRRYYCSYMNTTPQLNNTLLRYHRMYMSNNDNNNNNNNSQFNQNTVNLIEKLNKELININDKNNNINNNSKSKLNTNSNSFDSYGFPVSN